MNDRVTAPHVDEIPWTSTPVETINQTVLTQPDLPSGVRIGRDTAHSWRDIALAALDQLHIALRERDAARAACRRLRGTW